MIVCDDNIRVSQWVSARMGDVGWSACQSIGLERRGKLIAGVVYDYFNGASICMHVAAEGSHWLNREFLWYSFHYPFVELGCQRVTGLIPESNCPSRRFAEHIGFEPETKLERAHKDGSVIVYRMFRERCRWLRVRGNNEQTIVACHA